MTDHRPPPIRRRFLHFTWQGPSARWLILLAALLLLSLGVLLSAVLLGAQQGLVERRAAQKAQIEEHYRKGLDHLQSGRDGLALAEFEMVLRLDPSHAEALDQLRALQGKTTPLALTQPTPTAFVEADDDLQASKALYQQVQAAIQRQEWPLAAALLEELLAAAPDYRAADVEALRFGVAYQQGLDLVGQGRTEEGLRAFDQALVMRPGDANAQAQRQLALQYGAALAAWGEDWRQVVDSLQAIYDDQPDYGNVADQLSAAQETWGDELAGARRWCASVEHYTAALAVQPSADLEAKQRQAATGCAQTPAATSVAQQEATPESASGGPYASPFDSLGGLAFAARSTQSNRWIVYRLSLRSGEQVVVTEDASQPAISPAGDRLAVRSERGDQTGLAALSSDGSGRQRLTTFAEDSHPRWSPDGRHILFDSNREGDRRWRIYRIGAEGGQEISLGYGRRPAWSPQGKSIAFQGCDERGNRCGLWIVQPDGAGLRNVTDVAGDTTPAWSPDGARLAFASSGRSASWDVHLLDLQSGRVTPLTTSPGVDAHPVWSPDGDQVAFLSNRDGVWAIYIATVSSGQIGKATNLPGNLPDWLEAQISWGR